ncbi:type II secretion system F family protein [Parvularcula maris]|uniref:Type II secretion system F family protein n=1 Tax=Parvularcula maris TaxID=2965077 RepID=A0A9X2LB80_9PROT|nr:type II secretion system F family protein [Parvularcula maris]MCQ8186500.1 type II secretion system F family protein [Parvularcula maris]
MPEFAYKAVTRSGEPVAGTVAARDRDHAFSLVVEKGELPTTIGSATAPKSPRAGGSRFKLQRTSLTDDRAQFTGQLAALIGAGVPLSKALPLARRMTSHPALSAALEESEAGLEGGQALSAALSRHEALFSPLYIGLVRSGESSGQLAEVLTELGRYLVRMNQIARSAVTALIYPIILVIVTVLAVVGLLLFVLPEFEALLEGVPDLAWHTDFLFSLSRGLREHGIIVLIAAAALAGLVGLLWRSDWARGVRRDLTYRLPIAGNLAHLLALSRFSFTLSLCAKGGLPLLSSVALSRDVAGGPYAPALDRIAGELKGGSSLSSAIREEPVFPERIAQTVEVGEALGQLGDIFAYMSERYEAEFDEALKRVLALLEPCLILILGVMVGGVVGSVLVAVFAAQSGVL